MTSKLEEQLREVFREEAAELLGELRATMSALRTADPGAIDDRLAFAMRLTHNLKGAASNVGLARVEGAAHALEDFLLRLRVMDTRALDEPITVVCEALSSIENAVAGDEETLLGVVSRLRSSVGDGGLAPPSASVVPPSAAADERGTISDARSVPQPSLDAVSGEAPPRVARTVRISVERLEHLFGFVDELLGADAVARRQQHEFEALRDAFESALNDTTGRTSSSLAGLLPEFDRLAGEQRRASRVFHRLARDLNDAMKRARMVPLSSLSGSLHRTVDDAARSVHKLVDLELMFERVELDRTIFEGVRDPLMHLLRNAVDHGIESAATRDLRGKPARGSVRISADIEGATVRIVVADDGRGIDLRVITDSLVERKLLGPADVSSLSDDALLEHLFEPGFSTRASATRLSGRGVGLDVVRKQVSALGGSVRAVCRGPLGGAAFVLAVPVSILSTRALLVRAGTTVYAVPAHAIERVARIPRSELQLLEGSPVVSLGVAKALRLRWLSRLFSSASPRAVDPLQVLVLAHGGSSLAVVVDEVLQEEELVVRALPWNLISVRGVSGAAVLPDGAVAVAVDVAQIVSGSTPGGDTSEVHSRTAGSIVLVVDDSMTTRTLHRNVLESAGYQVLLANDGNEAWDLLRHTSVDAVVSDVQMPFMNGFELTKKIRQDPRLSALTVVLVTSLGTPEDVQRGVDAGADSYVVKGPLERDALLDAVRRHLG